MLTLQIVNIWVWWAALLMIRALWMPLLVMELAFHIKQKLGIKYYISNLGVWFSVLQLRCYKPIDIIEGNQFC